MDISAVREVDGVPVRALTIEVAPEIALTIFDASEVDERLDRAVHDSNVDPYASILWPASLAVAMELPGLISPGDYVLDLGSGTGLATLTAAYLGAYATAYDHDRFALRLIEEAAHLQGLEVETIHFDLHSSEPLPPADLMIAADLLYDYDLAHAVARRVVEQVRSGGSALVADPGRIASYDFLNLLREHGVHGHYHPVEVWPPGEEAHSTYVEIHIFG
jgi:predicted nicotinamide N-methyase